MDGIGNAYSDEILHAAQLSPLQLTSRLTDEQVARLYDATRQTLVTWRARLIEDTGDAFPAKVTAFHEGMAAHGRYGKPCPALRHADPTHPLRDQRGELLSRPVRPADGSSPIAACRG